MNEIIHIFFLLHKFLLTFESPHGHERCSISYCLDQGIIISCTLSVTGKDDSEERLSHQKDSLVKLFIQLVRDV